MAEQDRGSDDPQLAAIARHALHDEELIAAFAADDIDDPAERERARSLVDRCPTCRELHSDLAAIRAAIRTSGTAAERASTTSAPRDFRLTAEDAARLRPESPAARLAVRLGWRARLDLGIAAFGRPVGAAMATFGIVGLLVGSLTLGGVPLGASSGAAAPTAAPGMDQTRPGAEASAAGGASGAIATAAVSSPAPAGPTERDLRGGAGSVVLLSGSLALVVIGLGLIVAARRNAARISAQRGN